VSGSCEEENNGNTNRGRGRVLLARSGGSNPDRGTAKLMKKKKGPRPKSRPGPKVYSNLDAGKSTPDLR